MPLVYLSLGSNLGDRAEHLRRAVERLHGDDTSVTALSSLYETIHTGPAPTPVPAYLNCALRAETSLSPEALLERTQRIEAEGGRAPTFGWAPRTIDIDLLLYEGETRSSEQLSLPHPRLFERAFVMIPLLEIEPGLEYEGKSIRSRFEAADLAGQRVTPYPEKSWPAKGVRLP